MKPEARVFDLASLINSDTIDLPSKGAGQKKTPGIKLQYKNKRMEHGEEVGVKTNFFTAINRGEW